MGPYLSQPITSKTVKHSEQAYSGISYVSAEMQGWRKTMEDACIHQLNIADGNSIFGVFDGHGGFEVSKYVAEQFIKILTELPDYKKKQYKPALDDAFRIMDQKIKGQKGTIYLNDIRGAPLSEPISKNTGCTANVILITPTHFFIANAGDSRSVLCREGKAIDLSFDHKPESEQQETRIKNAGGVVYMGRVNGGLNLTRSFGDFDYKANQKLGYDLQMITCKPDIKEVKREGSKDEYIIMGCDGIWQKYVENSQGLIDIVSKHVSNKLQDKVIIEKLLDELIAKDTTQGIGCDNMTAVLIKFK